MKDGFYWAWIVGAVEGTKPVVVEVWCGDNVYMTSDETNYELSDFNFISKEPLPFPDRS